MARAVIHNSERQQTKNPKIRFQKKLLMLNLVLLALNVVFLLIGLSHG